MTAQELAQLIWNIKESIRGLYDDSEVENVILPFTLLRRLDCVLEDKTVEIMNELRDLTDENQRRFKLKALMRRNHLSFFNTSGLSLFKLLGNPEDITDNFKTYLNGFTDNVKDILSNFVHQDTSSDMVDLSQIYDRLARSNKLFAVTQKFAQVPLHLNEVDNNMMGTVFEIVIRYSKETTNTKAGQFYTPREVVRLLVSLTLCGKEEHLYQPGKIFSIYDPCCGTGGMLTEGKEYLKKISNNPNLRVNVYGQELNEKTYAICKSDLLMKGELQDLEEQIVQGNTLTNDHLFGKKFNFMLANPPFGMDWGDEYNEIAKENCVGGRFEAGLPDKSDGSLLFLLHMISKMDETNGSRIGIVLNGSPLFNGAAGSGWSNIRKLLLDRNLLDAIVALPKNLFYGTDISTYLWILDNKRPEDRRDKVMFINASHAEFAAPLQRSLGKKRFEISENGIEDILSIYREYVPCSRNIKDPDTDKVKSVEVAKVLDYADFLYTHVTVDRPLRLRYENLSDKYEELCQDAKFKPEDKKNAILKEVLRLDNINQQRTDAEFFQYLQDKGLKLKAAEIKQLRTSFGAANEEAPVVYEKPLNPKSALLMDSNLRDSENIPAKDDIDLYFEREVLHFAPDAVMDRSKDKVGCEFPFTKLFYVYKPLRSVEDIVADIKDLEKGEDDDLMTFIQSL